MAYKVVKGHVKSITSKKTRKGRRIKRKTQKQKELQRITKLSYGMRKRGYELHISRLSTATLKTLRSAKDLYRYATKDGMKGTKARELERLQAARKAASTRKANAERAEQLAEEYENIYLGIKTAVREEYVNVDTGEVVYRYAEEAQENEKPVSELTDQDYIDQFYKNNPNMQQGTDADIVNRAEIVYDNFLSMLQASLQTIYSNIDNLPSKRRVKDRYRDYADYAFDVIKTALDKVLQDPDGKVKVLEVLDRYDTQAVEYALMYNAKEDSAGSASQIADDINDALNGDVIPSLDIENPWQEMSDQSDWEYGEPDF
jgi:hypothetical protein